jgi:hypothetical protein
MADSAAGWALLDARLAVPDSRLKRLRYFALELARIAVLE